MMVHVGLARWSGPDDSGKARMLENARDSPVNRRCWVTPLIRRWLCHETTISVVNNSAVSMTPPLAGDPGDESCTRQRHPFKTAKGDGSEDGRPRQASVGMQLQHDGRLRFTEVCGSTVTI
jgi:hypothetical protein